MSLMQDIQSAATYLKGRINVAPKAVLVLGSGLGDYADRFPDFLRIPYADIPGFASSTVAGHKGQLVLGDLFGLPVAIMQGRLHTYEGYAPDTVAVPIRALRLLGAQALVLTNAAGGVNADFSPGDLMLIDDHINFSGMSPLRGENLDAFGPRFPDMTMAYDKGLKALMLSCADEAGIRLRRGVYMMFPGPQFETPAEIRFARTIGADAVGMSTVPEVIVARHAGMRIAAVSCITNMAAGMLEQPLTHGEVMETGARAKDVFTGLIDGFFRRLAGEMA
jgi:purine-nucleoside phosphorylase